MSEAEVARLDRIEALLNQLLAKSAPAPVKAAYTPPEFAALIGRSARWVQGRVSIGLIPRVNAAGTRNVLIPASALESFRTGKARL
jgi:hypothetical protein